MFTVHLSTDISKSKNDVAVQPKLNIFSTTLMEGRRWSSRPDWYEGSGVHAHLLQHCPTVFNFYFLMALPHCFNQCTLNVQNKVLYDFKVKQN